MKKKKNENENKKLLKEKDYEQGREKEILSKYNPSVLKDNKDQALLKEVFLGIFVVLSVILCLTLFFYYRVNSNYEVEISMMKDIHHLKANIVSFNLDKKSDNLKKIQGYLEITESFDGVNIIGKVEGLSPGSTHGVHVLEYSDLPNLEPSKITREFLKHYNPTNAPHSLPMMKESEEEDFHAGDFSNIIANHEGSAFLSLTRRLPIKSLNGRLVVILNSPDKSDPKQEFDKVEDILGYGILFAVKPIVPSQNNYSNDYLMREINIANKKEFEKKNQFANKLEQPFIPVEKVKYSTGLKENKKQNSDDNSKLNLSQNNNNENISKSSEISNRGLYTPPKKVKSWFSNFFSNSDNSENLKLNKENTQTEKKINTNSIAPPPIIESKKESTQFKRHIPKPMSDLNMSNNKFDNSPQNDEVILKDFRNLNSQQDKSSNSDINNYNSVLPISDYSSSGSIVKTPSIQDLPLLTKKPPQEKKSESKSDIIIDPYTGLHYSTQKKNKKHHINKNGSHDTSGAEFIKINPEKNPFEHLNLNNPVSSVNNNDLFKFDENSIFSSPNHKKKNHKNKKRDEDFDNTMKKLLDDIMKQEEKDKKKLNEHSNHLEGLNSHKESPLVSLAQISQNEGDQNLNLLNKNLFLV
jgi:Cu/Zn superoxide dismutase